MTDVADLESRASSDGWAALALAESRLLGIGCKPDQKAAYRAVVQSAKLGYQDGRRAWVYVTASGVGCKADPKAALAMLQELAAEDRFAEVQRAFLGHLTCEQRLAEIEPKIVSADPYIALYPQLFSSAECRYLMLLGNPWMMPGQIYDPASKQPIKDKMRDADAATIPVLAEDLVVQAINRCIATATGTKWGWGEPLTILRYQPGQQYRPHLDVYGPDKEARRQQTALIWLNGEFEGGETNFPKLGITVRGGIGDLLVFRNLTDKGEADPRMLHAGLPVTSGTKWMASRWIRSKNYLE